MRPWDFIKHELELIQEIRRRDALGERTWICEPLLVIDSDGKVAFLGDTNVEVKPHEDGTADLIAEGDRAGWHPGLNNAEIKWFSYEGMTGSRHGVECFGRDSDGYEFAWYINGAADVYAEQHVNQMAP